MNVEQQPAAPLTSSSRRHVQLVLARVFWSICLVLGVGLYVGALPAYFASLHRVVFSAVLGAQQLTPGDVRSLHALGLSLDFYAWLTLSVNVILLLVYVLVGVVLFWRASSNSMAWLSSFSLVLFPLSLNGQIVTLLPPVFMVLTICAQFLGNVSLGLFFSLFPGGRFVPRWAGFLAAAWVVYWALNIFLPTLPGIFSWLSFLILLVMLVGQLTLQIYRYRRLASPTERQQIKWVVFGIVVTFGSIFLVQAGLFGVLPLFVSVDPLTSTLGQTLSTLLILFFPLSIGFAILRSRLWDIDIVINRTLVYGALTASVVGIYVLVVGGLGTLLQAQGNLVLSLLATGLVAILFQPLRMRLQRAVNRLMYGERDDPYRVISRLGQRLEAVLAPEAVLPAIVEMVAQTLKLPYAAITFTRGEELVLVASHGTAQGEAIRLPLIYQAEQVGELILAPRAPGESFTPADRRLLEDLARQAGVVAHAVRLTEDLKRLTVDLQRSRERLVTAREEERRRLRRDLHDGLGPQLASLTLKLETARNRLAHDPLADTLLSDLTARTQTAVADIRRLVYALRPPALDELGLIPALREQALQYTDEKQASLSISLDAPDGLPELAAAVEVAAYRIAQEALTNVIRHAQAHHCTIRLALDETAGTLTVEVRDDGRGWSPGRKNGIGFTSMRERAEELGGRLSIEPVSSGGLMVRAQLPCSRPPLSQDESTHLTQTYPQEA